MKSKRYLVSIVFTTVLVLMVHANPPLPGELAFEPECLEYDMISRIPITLYTSDTLVNELAFTLIFDATKLEYVDFLEAILVPGGGWDTLNCTETLPGQLDFYAFSENGHLPLQIHDNLFFIDLCCTWSEGDPGDLTPLYFSDLSGDIAEFISIDGNLEMGYG